MQREESRELVSDPFQRVNERALINIVPDALQNAIVAAHTAKPEYFGLTEEEAEEVLDVGQRGLGAIPNTLRLKFWMEYDEAQAEHRNMKPVKIYAGVCDDFVFYKIIKDPKKLAWILTRPAEYVTALEELHQFSLGKLREILAEPVTRSGKYNPANKDKIRIFELIDQRLKGAVVQKTLNLNASVPASGAKDTEKLKGEELDRRLRQLEQHQAQKLGQIIDASIVPAQQTDSES